MRSFRLQKDFEESSGLKLNIGKTEGFSLNCTPISSIKIKWNPKEFKYLGILLCRDPQTAQKINLERAVKIFRAAIQTWSHRKLTFEGKKTIVNVHALSKIMHILVPIYVPPSVFDELNKIARNFLWSGSNNKIAFDDMVKPLEEGGLNFPHPELRVKSQKFMWLRRLLFNDNDKMWAECFRLDLKIPIELIGLGSTITGNIKNMFIAQIFQIFHEVGSINPPINTTQIINEPLWRNQYFTYTQNSKKYPLYLKNWYAAGFKTIANIWNFNDRTWLDPRSLQEKIHLFTELQYKRVMEAVSPYEPLMRSAKPDMINNNPKIRTQVSWSSFNKITSRKIYQILILRKSSRPIHERYIQNWFNSPLDWKSIYMQPMTLTRNVYLLQTQFKLSHNILPTNEKLFIWKKLPQPLCLCGELDTNIHFSVQCELIKPFWGRVFNFIKSSFETDFPISDIELYFGIQNTLSVIVIDCINYILLNAKVFVWKEKRFGKPCNFFDFLPYLRENVLVEMSTKTVAKPFLTELSNKLCLL